MYDRCRDTRIGTLCITDLVTLNGFVLEEFQCGYIILNPIVCEVKRPKRILAFIKVHI